MTTNRFNQAAFMRNPVFNYLNESDKFLVARPKVQFRFTIIGTGIMGLEHIRVTLMEGRATIHGIYDPNAKSVAMALETADRFCPGQRLNETIVVYDSLEAACGDEATDAFIICTPNHTHIDVVPVVVKAGKPILLEKPIATTVKDAHAIVKLANAHKAVFQLGLQYRFKPQYAEALFEVLERGSVGTVKLVSMAEHRIPFLDKVDQWNKFANQSGDTLLEKCTHYFDLMARFAGSSRPQKVYAVGSQACNFKDLVHTDGRQSDILDNGMVILSFENGVQSQFQINMFSPMLYEELVVCGDKGRLRATETEDFLAGPESTPTTLEIHTVDGRPSRKISPLYPKAVQSSGHQGATYIEHIEFVNQLLGQTSQAATAEEAFWSIVIAAAAQESIKSGQPVMINDLLKKEGIEI